MSKRDDGQWVPLEEAATLVKRKASTLISQMRRRRLERDRHYRYIGDGKLELNVLEYLRWLDYEKAERKRPLVERMVRQISRNEEQVKKVLDDIAQKPPQTSQSTSPSTKSQPKLIPLSVWVDQTFGEYPPSRNTVLRWVKNGLIHPAPKKLGRGYYISPDAEYMTASDLKIRRMVGY